MTVAEQPASRPSTKAVWIGRILSGIAALFLLFDAIIHIMRPVPAAAGIAQLVYPLSTSAPLGTVELLLIALYAMPRTAVLGAVLLTGYLGGAIAAQTRVSAPLVGSVVFPLYIALFLWGGLYLREPRLRQLLPFRV